MSKDKITDYSTSAASNSDIGGISIAEGCAYGNMNDAVRMFMKHMADMNAGTNPLADTVTFGDPADLTKRFRLDAGSITTGTTRVITMPDSSGTMVLAAGAQALQSKTFADAADATKVLAFDLDGIATATTRTVIWPDSSGTVMLADLYPTANSLDGLSLVSGDILYATAENTLQRLAKGTDGETLKLAAGVPSWEPSDRWVYLTDVATTSGSSTAEQVIEADATEIEVIFFGVSGAAGGGLLVRIGPSGGVETTGYSSASSIVASGATGLSGSTTGFVVANGSAGAGISGIMRLARSGSNASAWVASHACYRDSSNVLSGGGAKTITGSIGTLSVVISGDTFDAGSVAIRYRR